MPTLKCKGLQHLKNNPVISLSVHKKKRMGSEARENRKAKRNNYMGDTKPKRSSLPLL